MGASETESRKVQPASRLTGIRVAGFKSLTHENASMAEIRSLTVLAGANSSGKSSLLQPLLLMKQTLESREEPEALVLDGAHVQFANASEFFSRVGGGAQTETDDRLEVKLQFGPDQAVEWMFRRPGEPGAPGIVLDQQEQHRSGAEPEILTPNSDFRAWNASAEAYVADMTREKRPPQEALRRELGRRYGFVLGTRWGVPKRASNETEALVLREDWPVLLSPGVEAAVDWLWALCRVPGSRGRPQRSYRRLAIRPPLRGDFTEYVASLLLRWQELPTDQNRLPQVVDDLSALGLVDAIVARRRSDAWIDVQVPWRPGAGTVDDDRGLVHLADVGLGVSHALPVVVALHAAEPGQCVYLEQPELHLHPRAQIEMAGVLARAVQRGVQVIVETHSATLLLALQALVAESGGLEAKDVMLHWFERDPKSGATQISSRGLDEKGAYGDWPVDFDSVELKLQSRYLDAVDHLRRPA